MAATLSQNGIYFSDGTLITKREWIFAAGTDFTFWASSAPTGWTKQTTHNNKALRVVNGNFSFDPGGGSGGSQPFTTVCSPTFAYAGTLTGTSPTGYVTNPLGTLGMLPPQLPSHFHTRVHTNYSATPALYNPAGQFIGYSAGDVRRTSGWSRSNEILTGAAGAIAPNGASAQALHTHPTSSTGPVNVTFTLGVRYIDMIICSFDG